MPKAQSVVASQPKLARKVATVAAMAVVGAGVVVAARSVLKKKQNRDKVTQALSNVKTQVKKTRKQLVNKTAQLRKKAAPAATKALTQIVANRKMRIKKLKAT